MPATNRRALVVIANRTYPVIAVGHDQRHTLAHVTANQQHGRQRLTLVDSLQILVDVRLVPGEQRQVARP